MEGTSFNQDFGDAKEEVEVAYEGPPIEVGFNARYLLEVLNVVDTSEIWMELKDEGSPCDSSDRSVSSEKNSPFIGSERSTLHHHADEDLGTASLSIESVGPICSLPARRKGERGRRWDERNRRKIYGRTDQDLGWSCRCPETARHVYWKYRDGRPSSPGS